MGDVEKVARQVLGEFFPEFATNHGWPNAAIDGDEPQIAASQPERAGREGDSQPMPITHPGEPDIQSLVVADLVQRREIGIGRYGTALQTNNGRDALVDAYEEALDLACYLKQRIVEEEKQHERVIWHEAYTGALERLVEDMSPIHYRHLIDMAVEMANVKTRG